MITKKTFVRWTYSCWIAYDLRADDLQQLIGNSYATRQDLYDSQSMQEGTLKVCNCGESHKAIKIELTVLVTK